MMYDGLITGEYLEIIENEVLLIKDWRMRDWKDESKSTLLIKFSDNQA